MGMPDVMLILFVHRPVTGRVVTAPVLQARGATPILYRVEGNFDRVINVEHHQRVHLSLARLLIPRHMRRLAAGGAEIPMRHPLATHAKRGVAAAT